MSEIQLKTKLIGEIKGDFIVPDYQRGYRWSKKEIEALLNDIYEYGNSKQEGTYCLQPIVVRNLGDKYELIDGQQRLTTLFLILSFIQKEYKNKIRIDFSISYETRDKSEEFLKKSDETKKYENIDFFFIYEAYQVIKNWFEGEDNDPVLLTDKIYNYLKELVKVIWYEVSDTENSIDLFTRLNIGKIPLTNSELVKALFLKNENENKIKQEELTVEWDNIEKELGNEEFWSFLTNSEQKSPRIDLVLDLMSKKDVKDKEDYRTFYYFENELKNGKKLEDIWNEIQHTFLTLKEWFLEHDFYHKIGYLIASQTKTLQEILNCYEGKNKSEFKLELNRFIIDSIKFNKNIEELNYNKDQNNLQKLLLLFNIESVRQIDDKKRRFPFSRHKSEKWSLEHIHAQHSEGLNTNEKIKDWLNAHIRSLKSLLNSDENNNEIKNLIEELKALVNKIENEPKTAKIKENFDSLQKRVVELLSSKDSVEGEYIDLLPNMALLSVEQNSAISNYTFDAKRNSILDMDKKGKYIPFCTKMVFLKYYSNSETNLHFWSDEDRNSYLSEIKRVLHDYIEEEKEE